jgi:hypothetical protein
MRARAVLPIKALLVRAGCSTPSLTCAVCCGCSASSAVLLIYLVSIRAAWLLHPLQVGQVANMEWVGACPLRTLGLL